MRRSSVQHGQMHIGAILCRVGALAASFAVLKLAVSAGADDAIRRLMTAAAENTSLTTLMVQLETQQWKLPTEEEQEVPEQKMPETRQTLRLPVVDVPSGETKAPPEEEAAWQSVVYDPVPEQIRLTNRTEYEIDTAGLLEKTLTFPDPGEAPQVLILHTHGSEAYSDADGDTYEASDPMRTLDASHSVMRLGEELAARLEESGIHTVHDTQLYDYPSYNGAYSRAMEAISAHLTENPSISVVIDLHRDAADTENGSAYKTVCTLDGEDSAQVMLVVGTDFSGLSHDRWQENMQFALHLQCAMETRHPGMTRPVQVSQYRYNQHATTGSLIVEVGYAGNTLTEARRAACGFADALADVLTAHTEK